MPLPQFLLIIIICVLYTPKICSPTYKRDLFKVEQKMYMYMHTITQLKKHTQLSRTQRNVDSIVWRDLIAEVEEAAYTYTCNYLIGKRTRKEMLIRRFMAKFTKVPVHCTHTCTCTCVRCTLGTFKHCLFCVCECLQKKKYIYKKTWLGFKPTTSHLTTLINHIWITQRKCSKHLNCTMYKLWYFHACILCRTAHHFNHTKSSMNRLLRIPVWQTCTRMCRCRSCTVPMGYFHAYICVGPHTTSIIPSQWTDYWEFQCDRHVHVCVDVDHALYQWDIFTRTFV